jgi:hypothetical protein
MSDSDDLNHEQIMLVQKHQLDQSGDKLSDINKGITGLNALLDNGNQELEAMMAFLESEGMNTSQHIDQDCDSSDLLSEEVQSILDGGSGLIAESPQIKRVDVLDFVSFNVDTTWSEYQNSAKKYAVSHGIDLSGDPFDRLMTDGQRIAIERRIKDEFTLKKSSCDKYDYLIAATCGLIGGIVDVFFVGLPGEGGLTKVADKTVGASVEKFASLFGWKGGRESSDSTKSAISFLERKFQVNYDQATTYGKNGTGGAVENLSTKNHHVKSLAHSPDLIGLFFSILNQFTSTSSFVSDGKIITIDTETYELKGSNFVSKVFSGFVNWIGHLFSDMAGSSGAAGRGSGIPIPFYSLLLLIDVGEFGQHKQSFSKIATQVFEQGYDFRHGIAMAIPVLITELLTRLMWVIKQRTYHNKDWSECIPSASNPELRRMLLVAHGSLCLVDGLDAGLRCGGNVVSFMLRANIIAWARFGSLALKEIKVMYMAGSLDHDAIDEYVDSELTRMLR